MAAITLTETAIANRALQYVGGLPLTNLWTDTSKNAVEIQNCYHMLRRAELRRNVWQFAIRTAALRAINTETNNQRRVTFGAWSAVATYAVNDVVLGSDGRVYYSRVSSNLNNDPSTRLFDKWALYFGPDSATEYVTTWSGSLSYVTGMHAVGSNGTVYIATQNSTNQNPVSAPTYWSATTDGVTATATSFFAGEAVFTGTKVYVSLANGNEDAPSGSAKWLALTTAPTLSAYVFNYPLGTYDSQQRNIFRRPLGFLRLAPSNPRQGAYRWLGAPTNNFASDWVQENGYISSIDAGPVVIRYGADVDDPDKFDPMFAEGLACRIALSVMAPLTQSVAKRQDVLNLYRGFMTEARLANAIETGSEQPPLDGYIRSRY